MSTKEQNNSHGNGQRGHVSMLGKRVFVVWFLSVNWIIVLSPSLITSQIFFPLKITGRQIFPGTSFLCLPELLCQLSPFFVDACPEQHFLCQREDCKGWFWPRWKENSIKRIQQEGDDFDLLTFPSSVDIARSRHPTLILLLLFTRLLSYGTYNCENRVTPIHGVIWG